MTNFEKITASAEALGAFLVSLNVADGPWDAEFRAAFCDACEREDCDGEPCPHQDKRNNPLWWLMLGEKPGKALGRVVMWVKKDGYREAMKEFAGKIEEARSERVKETGDKLFTHLEALLTELVEVPLPGERCRVVMDYDPDAENIIFSQLPAHDRREVEKMELTGKGKDILNKAEDVILQGVERLLETPEKMTGEDCRNLQTLVCTAGRIQAIRNGNFHSNYPD